MDINNVHKDKLDITIEAFKRFNCRIEVKEAELPNHHKLQVFGIKDFEQFYCIMDYYGDLASGKINL